MKIISHRGNLNGKNVGQENHPDYICLALNQGFDVEIDVHWYKDNYYLGHDYPAYLIKNSYFEEKSLWCHAKTIITLQKLLEIDNIHCFYHENDPVTLTSKNFLWTYPGKELTNKSVCVLLENYDFVLQGPCYGVCSDFPIKCKKLFN